MRSVTNEIPEIRRTVRRRIFYRISAECGYCRVSDISATVCFRCLAVLYTIRKNSLLLYITYTQPLVQTSGSVLHYSAWTPHTAGSGRRVFKRSISGADNAARFRKRVVFRRFHCISVPRRNTFEYADHLAKRRTPHL